MAAKYAERPAQIQRAANESTSFQKSVQSPRHQRVQGAAEHSQQHSHHHKKRRRSHESSGHESAPTLNSSSSSTIAEYYGGGGARVTRTAGITGLLTVSEQQIPRSPPNSTSAVSSQPTQARGHQRQSPTHAVSPSSPGANHNSSAHKQAEHTPLKPTVSAPATTEALTMPMKKPLPSDDVLNALFERLIEQLNLSPEKVAELNTKTPEQKWNLILAQHELQSGIACVFYIEQLVRHAQPELKEKKPKKKALENLQPLSKVLCDLEVDLRTNPNNSWVEEFVGSPNHGHVALIDLIKDLADSPYSVPRKNPQKYKVLERDPGHLHTSMLCLKSLMSHRHGFTAVLNYEASLCVLGYCFSSQTVSIRTRILMLKIFVTVLVSPSGHKKVMQAFDYVRAIMKEKMRFQMMMTSLTNEPVEPAYQAAALCFINTVVQTAQGSNAKVFHQHEFIQAGFSPEDIEKSLHGRQDERILHELKEWHNNFISVQHFMDDLAVAKGRIRSIQEELEQTQRHLHEANLDREALYEQTKKLIEKYEVQRYNIEKLHKTVDQLLIIKVERDKLQEEKELLMEVNSKYDYHIEELKNKVRLLMGELQSQKEGGRSAGKAVQEQIKTFNLVDSSTQTIGSSTSVISSFSKVEGTVQNQGENRLSVAIATRTERSSTAGETASSVPPPPAPPAVPEDGTLIPPPPPIPFGAPPVPPPPPIGGGMAPPGVPVKKPVIPNVLLPCLNWVPIRNPEHTIFKDLDDESVLETVDFSEFEALFQVKRFKKNAKLAKREDNIKKATSGQLLLIESRRARNLVIAKRRIGHSAEDIRDFILATDLDGLLPEYCELLLKFIPTQEELSELAKHANRVAQFGEAEQLMFQLAKIERYELRLNCMAYMGNFDELIGTTQPQIDAVLNASLSLFRSNRLRKVFEIILAFGNYMNSSRRGAVYGFKLESLSKLTDTKSHDRQLTLLNYIAHVVERVYPHVLSFYEDLDIEEACKVSMQILQEDVQTLKSGMKTVHLEMKKEPNNFIIFSFCNQAHKKVQHVGESFAKMEDAYREVCLMFSESPKNIDPTDFFCLFKNFIKEWKKVIQENHTTQRRHMKSTNRLIKVQEDVDNGTEAAVEATTRSQHIQQEAQKFTKKMEESSHVSNSTDGRVLLPGGAHAAMQDPKAYVKDIHNRSVHELDISDRIAWPAIKGLGSDNVIQPRINEDHEQGERTHRDNSERLTSPDSGVIDHLSEVTESLDGNTSSSTYYTHSVTSSSTPHLTSKSHNNIIMTEMAGESPLLPPAPDLRGFQSGTPSHLQNGELPLRDYPILPPPKDYPIVSSSLEQEPSKLAGDAAYTMQEAKLNSRSVKAKARTHQGGASGNPPH